MRVLLPSPNKLICNGKMRTGHDSNVSPLPSEAMLYPLGYRRTSFSSKKAMQFNKRGGVSTKACGHSFEGHEAGGEIDHGLKALIGLVVARGDAAELLQGAEEVLDEMPPAIHRKVTRHLARTIGFGRDDSGRTTGIELLAQRIIVEALVSNQSANLEPLEQGIGSNAVMTLARQKQEVRQIAKRIHQGHDLGGQAATRAPDGLTTSPPLAPVPCWWTRMIVPSMSAYSKSGSPERAWKMCSNTLVCAQRRKRRNTLFQFPNISGRSRQGAPVRTIHSTASRNSRLSAPERPGSPGLPGSNGATRAHCSSFRTNRFKTDLQFAVLKQISSATGIPDVTGMSTRLNRGPN